jgi:excinuclease ABC subunit C
MTADATDPLGHLRPGLREVLERLPREPGVYILRGHEGEMLYIGKGKNLSARVRSYFSRSSGDTRAFVPLLEHIVGDVETIVTRNEKEALLLENTLIKKHTPRFNVMLRDDKSYLVLRLDPGARFPRLEVTRRIRDDGARYFGPYHSATSCRQTLRLVNRHFQLRTCTDRTLRSRRRPCLQHQIGRCLAPCVLEVDPELYGQQVRDVTLFLRGRGAELITELDQRMREAAAGLEFELAARIRDQIAALRSAQLAQQVVAETLVDQDVFGFHREGDQADVVVLQFREGKLVGRRPYSLSGQEFPDQEMLSGFVSSYYLLREGERPPARVLVPLSLEDDEAKRQWLADLRDGPVEILVPRRGDRRRLLDLAQKNARANFATRRRREADLEEALAKLQRRLRLTRPPRRIECFDISGFQGQLVVASMAVLTDGEPERSRYRHFTIQSEHKDDFAAMYEALSRRLQRARSGEAGWELPDLIVVDGGKAQLSMAVAALRDAALPSTVEAPDLVALAKERPEGGAGAGGAAPSTPIKQGGAGAGGAAPSTPIKQGGAGAGGAAPSTPIKQGGAGAGGAAPSTPIKQGGAGAGGAAPSTPPDDRSRRPERVFLVGVKDPLVLRENSAELYILTRVRDEAHRFAITHHKKLRRRRGLRSGLDDIPGIGPKRKRELLKAMGSLRRIREAGVDELAAVPGMTLKAAEAVAAYLKQPEPDDD